VPVRSPWSVRPWQHVLEPLSGYLTLAQRMLGSDDPCWCDAWNFGPLPGEEIPVGRLVEQFVKDWGGGNWQDVSNAQAPHEAGVLRLNIDKALHQLGWRPRWNVCQAVRRTADWFRRFHQDNCTEMRQACLEDLNAYEAAV
jgi:CDP-glucose 4,6-dehydratase